MGDLEEGLDLVAKLMAVSARTAPKARGEDFIEIKILAPDERRKLAETMVKFGEDENLPGFVRDGKNLLDSQACVLIGVRDPLEGKDDMEGKRPGPKDDLFMQSDRVKRFIDLGIALGSAAKTASIHNVDNRIMWRVGEMARREGLLKCFVVMGIPLSSKGKNIYFDR
jgi:uncharacterized ferredoxin-like protein